MTEGNNPCANVLVLGRTGCGKSSLINYIFGQNIAEAHAGKPVTEEGIYEEEPFLYHQLNIHLFDSWGIEESKADKWISIVEEALKNNYNSDIKKWFSSIIYCVDAYRSRIDSYEITNIIQPLIDDGNKVIFVFTKCDTASQDKIDAVRKVISDKFPGSPMHNLCSIEAVLRNGKHTVPSGKDKLLQEICFNLHINLINKLFKHAEDDISPLLFSIKSECLDYFDKKAGFFTNFNNKFIKNLIDHTKQTYTDEIIEKQNTISHNIIIIDNITEYAVKSLMLYDADYAQKRSIKFNHKDLNISFNNTLDTILNIFCSFVPSISPAFLIKQYFQKKNLLSKYSDTLDKNNCEMKKQFMEWLKNLKDAELINFENKIR